MVWCGLVEPGTAVFTATPSSGLPTLMSHLERREPMKEQHFQLRTNERSALSKQPTGIFHWVWGEEEKLQG